MIRANAPKHAYWGPPTMTNARLIRAAAAGCLLAVCAAPGASAQMQGFGYGAAVNTGAAGGGLQMPGENIPTSTFYGLGSAPNAGRLPGVFRRDAGADTMGALTASAGSAPLQAAEGAPVPPVKEAAAAPAPKPAPAPAPGAEEPAFVKPPEPQEPVRAAEKAPEPVPEPAPALESAALTPPEAPGKKASADIPPAPEPKAAPEPQPAAVETAAADPEPEPDPGVTRLIFAAAESKPDDAALNALKKAGGRLLEDETARLEIRAYAGGDGVSANRARRLSLARALAVRSQLIELGVRSNRIDVRALGDKTDEKPFNRVDLALTSGG